MKVLNNTYYGAATTVAENVLVDQPGSPEVAGTFWLGRSGVADEYIEFGSGEHMSLKAAAI